MWLFLPDRPAFSGLFYDDQGPGIAANKGERRQLFIRGLALLENFSP